MIKAITLAVYMVVCNVTTSDIEQKNVKIVFKSVYASAYCNIYYNRSDINDVNKLANEFDNVIFDQKKAEIYLEDLGSEIVAGYYKNGKIFLNAKNTKYRFSTLAHEYEHFKNADKKYNKWIDEALAIKKEAILYNTSRPEEHTRTESWQNISNNYNYLYTFFKDINYSEIPNYSNEF